MARVSLATHRLPDCCQLLLEALIRGHDVVEGAGDLPELSRMGGSHANAEVTRFHRAQRREQLLQFSVEMAVGLGLFSPACLWRLPGGNSGFVFFEARLTGSGHGFPLENG